MSVTVFGYSDDLIEVEGDIREEFTSVHADDDGDLLAFSDGTVLRIGYDRNGVWRIRAVVDAPGRLSFDIAPEDDDENYSDRATLLGDIRWVVLGSAIARRLS